VGWLARGALAGLERLSARGAGARKVFQVFQVASPFGRPLLALPILGPR
jgi:hypothetical protein